MPTATADPPHYELLLLGPPLIRAAGREPVLRRKTRLLLVYLAASRRAHTRGELLRLFCPEAADPRATLRNLLSRVRRKVGASVLVTDEERVRFNDAVAEIDVPRFAAVLSAPERRSLEELRSALDLYRGQFAADLEADDLPEVALWLLSTRTGLQNLYERGLSELLTRLTAARAFPAAIEAAQRLLLINPLHEMAHGRLIQLYAAAGQVEAAQIQYQRCRELLATELAVSPSPELEALATAALQGSGATHVQLAPPPALKDRVTPLVGRSAALAALEEALYSARSGRGRVVLLEGEPGSGKSYLAHTFARRQQLALLQGSAYEVESAVAFGPWREVIEARAALLSDVELRRLPFYVQQALRRLVPGLGAHLRGALPTGARLQPDNLHYALSDFLLQPQAEQLPLVALFIDNLQWADHASLHLFHFLARRVAAQPLLLLGAWHPPARHDPPEVARLRAELDRLHPIVIALQPLDETDIGALLEQQRNELGAEGRAVLARRVWQATGGNAFFASEVVRELDGRQELPEQMPLPDSIRTLFSRRSHALPAGQRQVIEAVAIMTETTQAVVTQQVGGRSEEETLLALDAGLGQRLLVEVELDEGLGYDVVHELARRTILEEMSGARRRALHRRAARALSALGAPWARVAHHWRAAGDAAAELHALHRAIAEAQAVFANEELVQLLKRALVLETEPAAGWALRFELAAVAQRTGRWEEGLAHYDHVTAAAQTAGLTGWLARSNLQRGKLLLNQGQYDEASGALAAAQTAFDAAPEAGAAYLHAVAAEQAHLLFRRGEMAAAEKLAETTAAAARAAGAAEAELRALSALSSVLGQTGRFDPALEHLRRQRELARELGNPTAEATVLTEMGHVAYFHGQLGLSEELLEASLAVHQRCGNLIGVARVEGNLGLVYAHQGDLVRAISRTERGLAMSEALAHKPNIAVHVGNLSFMYTMRNQFDAALASLSRALELDGELGHPEAVARHLGNRGTTYYHMGRDEQALADFERSLHAYRQLSHRAGESSILGDLGLLYGRRGDDEEALSYILAALAIDLELQARDGCARHLGNLARILLRRQQPVEARAACLRAVALEKDIGARRMLASDLETLATAEALLGNHEGAADLARESVAVSLEVERVDSEIGARCLLIRLRSAAGELAPAAAAAELLALVERSDDPRGRARIWDVLFEAAPDHPVLIDAPAALADAYAKQPAVWLRETHFRLTGRYLPAPTALAPDSQSPDPPALETLLPRVDALLSPLPGA